MYILKHAELESQLDLSVSTINTTARNCKEIEGVIPSAFLYVMELFEMSVNRRAGIKLLLHGSTNHA
jgi:hypothetical protein